MLSTRVKNTLSFHRTIKIPQNTIFYTFHRALQNEMLKMHSTNSTLNQVAAS